MFNLFRVWFSPTVEVMSSTSQLSKIGAATASFIFVAIFKALTPSVMGTLILLVLIDTLTGLLVAIKTKKVSSKRWYKSLIKMANYSTLIIVGSLAGDISLLSWLSGTFLMLIVITEVISILENVSIIQPGLIPDNIIKVLHLLKD